MKKYSLETLVGIFVLLGLICVGYMTVKLGKISYFGNNTYMLYARFSSVAGLRPGSAIDVFGIEVGTATYLAIDNQRQVAVVAMKIRKDVNIYSDAIATIRTMGLIGDKYIKIDPGGAGDLLKSGAYIMNTVSPPDIEDLIGQYIFGRASSKGSSPQEGK